MDRDRSPRFPDSRPVAGRLWPNRATLAPAGLLATALTLLLPLVALAQDEDGGGALAVGGTLFCFLILLVINILILVWVYRDANRRGANGALWAVLTFFFGLIALIIYLIVRPKDPSTGYRV